jgi:hypothetical protein
MPDPKKKSLDDLVTEAGNEVLGRNDSKTPPKSSMSEEELLATFGESEKKKSSQPTSTGLPKPPQEENSQFPELGKDFKLPKSESGSGSSNQSSKPEDNGVNMAMSAMNKISQRFYDLPAQLLETTAIVGNELLGGGQLNPVDGVNYPAASPQAAMKAANKYREWLKEVAPTNPKFEKEDPYYTNTIAGTTGDLLALVTTSGTARGTQALNQLTQASVKSAALPIAGNIAKDIAKNPGTYVGAMQMGTAEWEQAKQAGATDDEAFEVFYKNAAVGSVLEAVPVMHYFKRLDKVTGGGVKNAIKTGAVQGMEEMTTEVAQQYYSNYTASQTYDATRKWYDGMTESGGIGFGLGFVLGAMGGSLRKKRDLAQTPEEKAEIEKSIAFVDQKAAEMQNGTLNDQGETINPEAQPQETTGEITGEVQANEGDSMPVDEAALQSEQGSEPVISSQENVQQNDTTELPVTEQTLPEQPTEDNAQVVEQTQEVTQQPEEVAPELTQEPIATQEEVPVSETENVVTDEKANTAAPRATKVTVGKYNYQVKVKDGEVFIRNKDNKKKIDPNSGHGKKVLEAYKSKNIQKFSQGKTAEITPEMTDEDYTSSVISTSENPAEIAQVWKIQPQETLSGKEEVIKENLGRMPIDGIYQFGDRNNVTKGNILNYVSPKGQPIDVQAQEMANNSGLDITPQDIVDFIAKYPNGKNTARPENGARKQLEAKFKALTGLELTEDFAEDLDNFTKNYTNLKENKFISNQELTDAVFNEEDISKYRFLFDSDEAYTNALRNVKQKVRADVQSGRSATTQGTGKESQSNDGTSEEAQKLEEGTGQKREIGGLVRSLSDKVGSLRNAQSDSEKRRIAQEIIDEADGYLLNREGIMVADDGSFALPNGKTFFDLLDEGKSVYYLDPDAKVAKDVFDYQIIANELSAEQRAEAMEIMKEYDAIPFDDAFRLGMVDQAKKMGYDGFLMQEIDGTDSTVQVLNTDKITLVHGEDVVKRTMKEPNPDAVNTRSDAQVSIEANKGKTDINQQVGIVNMGGNLMFNVNDITKYTEAGKKFFQKWLTSNGFIPENVFKSWLSTEGNINAELSKMKYNIADFRRTVKDAYKLSFGQELPIQTKTEINAALSGNKEAFNSLPEKVQEAVSDMRAQVDYLSARMVNEGIVTGDLATKVQDNMGIYLFRSYQKHDNPDWAQEIDPLIINRAKSYIMQQMGDIAESLRNKAANRYSSDKMAFKNAIKQGAKFYNAEGKEITAKQAEEDIVDLFSKTNQEITDKYSLDEGEVDGIINELLYTPEAPMNLIKTGKLGSKDLSILKKRKDLAPEIRALYGEYSDPLVNYSKSVMKMINMIEKHKFLEDVKVQGMGKFLFERPTGKNAVKIAGDKSSTMAPLNGLYTTPEIATAFEEFNAAQNLPTWMEYYMKAISTVKAAKTVFNVTTHARNIIGNLAFVLANGHLNVGKSVDAFNTIKNDITSGDNQKFREAYQRYQKLGIVGDSGSASELKAMLEDAKLKPDKFDYVNTRMLTKAKKAVSETVGDLYAAEDDFYKIYAFENEFSRYKDAYGNTKSDAEIEQIAADIVKNTYPTYSKTNRLIKEMRKAPILGTFISFPAEVIRTTYNTAEITKNELKSDNPKVRMIGAKRLAGQLISAALVPSISMLTKHLYGIDDEEEEDIRKFVAPWSKNSLFLYTGPVEDGKVNMIDLSQTDPHGYWQKPIMSILDGGEDIQKNAIDASKQLLEPFFGLNMITEALIDAKSNKKTTGQDITNTSLPVGDQALDYTKYFFDFAKPGTLSSFDRIYKGYKLQGHPDEYGKIYNGNNELLAAFGGQRISSMDIPRSYRFAIAGVNNEGGIKQRIYESKKIYTGFKMKEQPYMSESEKLDIQAKREEALNLSVAALKRDLKDAQSLYFGAQRLGVTAKALKNITNEAKLPNQLEKIIYKDIPVKDLKMTIYKNGKETKVGIDEYLKRYLQK